MGLTVTGIDEFLNELDAFERAYRLNVVVALEWLGRSATQEMILMHEFQNITGRLERSIGYTVERWDANSTKLLIFALAPYADNVEYGTPTSRPYPFFWPAFYKYLEEGLTRLQAAIDEAGAAVSGGGRFTVRNEAA